MDFTLSDEQRLLKDSVSRFTEKEYDFESRRKLVSDGGFDERNWKTFAEMGWLMAGLPEEHGGLGGSAVETAIIMEEFGKALVLEPFLSIGILSARVLLEYGDRQNVAELLSNLAIGEARPVLAHSEIDAFGDVAWVETKATKTASGWKIDGRKTGVVGGPVATHFIVSARTFGNPGDQEGISLFLVPVETSGLARIDLRLSDGSVAAELVLSGVDIHDEDRIGIENEAYSGLAKAYAHATVAIGAEAVGAMEKALWTTRDYLKTREQFGQPIGNFQALQHRMADMLIELEMARAQVYRALAYLEAEISERDRVISSMKVQIGRSAKFIGGQAIQLHGGIGVTEEYLIGHYFKRLTMIDNMFGTVGVHLQRMGRLARAEA